MDAGHQILSDRQHFFADSTEVSSITTFWQNVLTCERNADGQKKFADGQKKFADGQKTLPTRLDRPL